MTFAEFTLSGDGNMDYYDGLFQEIGIMSFLTAVVVSHEYGYNLPVSITNDKGCPTAGCFMDLGPNCEYWYLQSFMRLLTGNVCSIGPGPLKGPFDSSHFPLGCKSACVSSLEKDPGQL